MPINASHEFFSAEKEYLNAKSLEDKIYWLEEMIKVAPKHKSSENLLKELRVRLKKFKEKSDKASKKSGGKKGIRKEGFQFALVGLTNKGKSSLLNKLTNANSKTADYQFTTKEPEIGTFEFEGVKAQIIDAPSIGSDYYDSGLINTADCLILVIENLDELEKIETNLKRARGTKIIAVNKIDKLNENELRKLEARIKSKRINGLPISAKTGEGLNEIKQILLTKTGIIRIYMKEPGKGKQERPMLLKEGATVKDVAEHIFKGFAKTVKEIKLTGPSSKFPNQRVGLNHKLKDKDVIEFHTR